ncbi:HNH endonuclease [Curtobacterium phage Parvaparticeps]|nr:HNH endonuclease [Curtobacterium phage Parvaparticeps]
MAWAPGSRGSSNSDSRGSAASRRARKQWLLDEFGDGTTAPCAFGCGVHVNFQTITVDRFPIPGAQGGRYVRGNIRPACEPCNREDGYRIQRELRHARKSR